MSSPQNASKDERSKLPDWYKSEINGADEFLVLVDTSYFYSHRFGESAFKKLATLDCECGCPGACVVMVPDLVLEECKQKILDNIEEAIEKVSGAKSLVSDQLLKEIVEKIKKEWNEKREAFIGGDSKVSIAEVSGDDCKKGLIREAMVKLPARKKGEHKYGARDCALWEFNLRKAGETQQNSVKTLVLWLTRNSNDFDRGNSAFETEMKSGPILVFYTFEELEGAIRSRKTELIRELHKEIYEIAGDKDTDFIGSLETNDQLFPVEEKAAEVLEEWIIKNCVYYSHDGVEILSCERTDKNVDETESDVELTRFAKIREKWLIKAVFNVESRVYLHSKNYAIKSAEQTVDATLSFEANASLVEGGEVEISDETCSVIDAGIEGDFKPDDIDFEGDDYTFEVSDD